jgi:hypothetical protein
VRLDLTSARRAENALVPSEPCSGGSVFGCRSFLFVVEPPLIGVS